MAVWEYYDKARKSLESDFGSPLAKRREAREEAQGKSAADMRKELLKAAIDSYLEGVKGEEQRKLEELKSTLDASKGIQDPSQIAPTAAGLPLKGVSRGSKGYSATYGNEEEEDDFLTKTLGGAQGAKKKKLTDEDEEVEDPGTSRASSSTGAGSLGRSLKGRSTMGTQATEKTKTTGAAGAVQEYSPNKKYKVGDRFTFKGEVMEVVAENEEDPTNPEVRPVRGKGMKSLSGEALPQGAGVKY